MTEPGTEPAMGTAGEADATPRRLSRDEAAQAACFLFELNTRERDVLEMAERAGLAPGTPLFGRESGEAQSTEQAAAGSVDKAVLLREWYAFVHAATVYGLMAEAPNAVVAEYLRATRDLLGKLAGYDTQTIDAFVDGAFAAYLRLMAQNRQKECPARFYQEVLACGDITQLASERVAFLSGMMAITMCAILDKVAKYTYSVD